MHFQRVSFHWSPFSIFTMIIVLVTKTILEISDLDATFRSVNGEQDEFQDINIKEDEIMRIKMMMKTLTKTRMMQILKMIAQKMLTKLQICQLEKKKI